MGRGACRDDACCCSGGLAQLAILTGGLSQALPLAIHPFVPLDAVKALVAALLVPKSTSARLFDGARCFWDSTGRFGRRGDSASSPPRSSRR